MAVTTYNYDHGIPCKNPHCRSYGRPHPNCRCGGGGVGALAGRFYEKAKNFASGVAESYGSSSAYEGFSSGGSVHYCTSGMPHDETCPHYADGGAVAENQQFAQDPGLSLDHAILERGLLHVLTKTGKSRSENPGKVAEDYMDAAKRGRKQLDNHAKNLLNPDAEPIVPNREDAEALGSHLEALQQNPAAAESVGGELGNAFPDHQVQLAGKLASVLNHFQAIKPPSSQGAPLDKINAPTPREQANYKRQLEIAQNPAMVYQRAKHAMLQPQDMATLQAVYPRLHAAMVNKARDAVVEHKSQGMELPRHVKHGLSQLMGQDLGFLQTPAAAQAIIAANAPMQPPGGGAQHKATNKAIDESNQQAQLEATADQARAFQRKQG
jgi:hypothetical protein